MHKNCLVRCTACVLRHGGGLFCLYFFFEVPLDFAMKFRPCFMNDEQAPPLSLVHTRVENLSRASLVLIPSHLVVPEQTTRGGVGSVVFADWVGGGRRGSWGGCPLIFVLEILTR